MTVKYHKATYEMIAGELKPLTDITTRDILVKRFADKFSQDNPLFNRQKFYKACGASMPIMEA